MILVNLCYTVLEYIKHEQLIIIILEMNIESLGTLACIISLLLCISFIDSKQGDNCPRQCQCNRGMWMCGNQNITEWTLQDLVLEGDPTKAIELDLKNNLIAEFPSGAFVGFKKLKEINLGANFLTKPPKNISQFIPSLEKLQLVTNRISSINKHDFLGYGSINYLDIFGNNITEIHPYTFENIPELRKLFAEGNFLKILEKGIFAGLNNLQWVTFQGNQIETISSGLFDNTPNLKRVWLGHNKLKSLPGGLFKCMEILDLKQNQLEDESIPTGAFCAETLVLNGNNLTTLKKEWFDTTDITYEITLFDNPIHCDCSVHETYNMLRKKANNDFFLDGKCASPPQLKGKELEEVFTNNLVNCTACSLNECQNNATCHEVDPATQDIDTYTCNCTTDKYYGKFCQNENYCYMSPCVNNGTCANTNTTFICACKDGYIGKNCEVEQPCFFNNPCLNNGTCIYLNGTFNHMCICMDGFTETNCQLVQDKNDNGLTPGLIVLIVLILLTLAAIVGVYLYNKRTGTLFGRKTSVTESTPLSEELKLGTTNT